MAREICCGFKKKENPFAFIFCCCTIIIIAVGAPTYLFNMRSDAFELEVEKISNDYHIIDLDYTRFEEVTID